MEIFGIGFPELLFIFVIALIVLGPRNMVKTSRQVSDGINKIVTSNTWKSVIKSTQEIRDMQDKIIQDTGLPETLRDFQEKTRDLVNPSIPILRSTSNNSISSSIDQETPTVVLGIPNKPDEINQIYNEQSANNIKAE
jgi:Sec-independent protein translocase protein TatA